jgi:hypothetical protein
MRPEIKSDEPLPDYLNWLLKSNGLRIEKIEKSNEGIEPSSESMDIIKIRELEQTKELLVGLTNELFNKIEILEKKKATENHQIKTKEKSQSKNMEKKKESKSEEFETREECKIEFSDLSWYTEKLDSKK